MVSVNLRGTWVLCSRYIRIGGDINNHMLQGFSEYLSGRIVSLHVACGSVLREFIDWHCCCLQSPAMAADIDRLGDSAQPVNVPAEATLLITEAGAPSTGPGGASQPSHVLPNGKEPVNMEQRVAATPANTADANRSDPKAEPDIR